MQKLLGTLLYLVLFSVQAQQAPTVNSPYETIKNYLYYVHEEHYDINEAAKPFLTTGVSKEVAQEAAIKLKQILDGAGIVIDLDEVPHVPDYVDSTIFKSRYVLTSRFPDVFVEKVNDEWKFPRPVIKAINMAHGQMFKFGTDRLLQLAPTMGTKKFFGLHVYQYIGLLILALLSVIIHKIFTFLFERLILKFLLQAGYEKLADNFLLPVARPISIFVVLLLLMVFLPVLQLPPDATQYFMLGLRSLIPLFATIVFYRMVDILAMYLERLAKSTESTLDDQLVPLFRKTLKAFVVAVGMLFVMQNLNIPIVPLLTGLSIGGLAFALAAQDTIKNFFGSLMIFIDKPFQIGDWITSGEIDGSVEEVGFRSSRIRTFRNSLMYVPNSKLADSTIDNHGMRQYRRFYTQLALTYDTPPELIETFVQGLHQIVAQHSDTRKDNYHIYLNDMSTFSINVMFYIFFEVPTWADELKARQEILLEVIRLAKQLGVRFAFPTQTLHMENFPGQPSMSPQYPDQAGMATSLNEFLNPKK